MKIHPLWEFDPITHTLIDLALQEDLGTPFRDITSATVFADVSGTFQSRIISKHAEPIVISGLAIVEMILKKLTENNKLPFTIRSSFQDGDILHPGEMLLTLESTAHILLMAERTILNFLQRLCAVATLTQKFVQTIRDTQLKILDTRKTLPGFRRLEKYAVFCGGGVNHRMGLYDAILVKDTHIDLLGGMTAALRQLTSSDIPTIIEVRTLDELKIVIEEGQGKVTRVLLDNMSPPLMAECVALCQNIFPTEASGNINTHNIQTIAQTGVDFASIGQLTHSAGCVDLSMKCDFQ
jgi:nicotinate-nucleotide pyrophosphorylase (carboxylating)